jgi:hypothetical protein
MLNITNIRDGTNNEWDALWESTKTATYYHSREWAEIWQSYTNGRIKPVPKIISFSDDAIVLLPFSRQEYYSGIIKRYSLAGPPAMALPYYGNWLTNDILTDNHITLLSKHIVNTYKNLVWRLNPYDENSWKISINSKYTVRRSLVTYMIDLTKGEDHIFSNMKQSCRNQIRQGIRNKLVVSEGTDIKHWKTYYEIYCDTLKRWGSKAIYKLDWKIFEIIFSKNNPGTKLWLVYYDGVAIAGGICFYSHKKIISWHIASLTTFHKLRPVNMLKYMIIKNSINTNYNWFDFETAGGKKGLQLFKKSFGPEERMCDMFVSWHPIIYHFKKLLNKKI